MTALGRYWIAASPSALTMISLSIADSVRLNTDILEA